MKSLLKLFFVATFATSCHDDPYEVGSHWSYSITCEEGFKYKVLDHHRGTIPLLNSDGTRVRCNEKKY